MAHHHTCNDVIVSDSTDVVSFRLSDVPEFLRQTEFFTSLEDDGEEITLPRQFFKTDLKISTPADARDVLSTMRFWGVEKIPSPLILYVAKSFHQDLSDMLSHFTPELKVVEFLRVLNREIYPIRPKTYDTNDLYIYFQSPRHKCTTVESVVSILALQFENERGQIWNERTTALVARISTLDCLIFLHEMGCPWDASTCAILAKEKRLDCLKYAHAHGCPWDAQTTAQALENRSIACFTFARDNGCPWDVNTCSAAARHGNLALLKTAHESGCPWDAQTCTAAVHVSSLDCLEFAHSHGCPWNAATCAAAAEAGNLAALTHAHIKGCPWDETTCEYAAKNSHLACLMYAHKQGCPWNAHTCTAAAKSVSSACLAYAHKNGCPWGVEVVRTACAYGKLECLRYALEHGCPGREIACESIHDNLACLKYLREVQKCPWNTRIADTFARALFWETSCLRYCLQQGCLADQNTMLLATMYVEKIKVLREHGCPWDKHTMHAVARTGKLETLKYCLENGCPGREDVVLAAAPHLPLLKYLHAQGCPLLPEAYQSALEAVRPIECIRFLFETGGCPWPKDACTWFVQRQRMDCLKYAHMHGAPWDAGTCAAAVRLWSFGKEDQRRALDFLIYLRDEGCPWDKNTLRGASTYGNTLCFQYALEHGCPDSESSENRETVGEEMVHSCANGSDAKASNNSSSTSNGDLVNRSTYVHQNSKKRKRSVARNSCDDELGNVVRLSERISLLLNATQGQNISKGNRLVARERVGGMWQKNVRRSKRTNRVC